MKNDSRKIVTVKGRYGRIQRRHLWPLLGPDEMPELRILTPEVRAEFSTAVGTGRIFDRIPIVPYDPLVIRSLTADRYFGFLSICYKAMNVGKSVRRVSIRESYRRCSDGRHGGLLEISPRSARAFCDWYFSTQWLGSHPFEFLRDSLCLFVQTQSYDAESPEFWLRLRTVTPERTDPTLILIALALAKAGVPFMMPRCADYAAFARGEDWVGVADYAVWEAGSPVWPEDSGMLRTSVNTVVTSDLACYPGALDLVEWFSSNAVLIRSHE